MKLILTIITVLTGVCYSNCQISDVRKFELDSLVSVMPTETKKDLWKAHAVMDSFAMNNEEKVWLFYGYIGANFKYDMERFREKKSPEYSPELTAQKGKAVCRDFARLFSALCEKSHIRSIVVTGKSDISFIKKTISYFRFNFHPGLHAWNLVEINSTWHLMDPTWSHVEKVEKIKVYSEKTKSYSVVKIKRCSRNYYNTDPEIMAQTHAPNHPAFYLLETIPTYKTTFKKKQKSYQKSYDYRSAIDSIFSSPFPMFSPVLIKGGKRYSKIDFSYYNYLYEISVPLLRPTRFQKFTIDTYNSAETRINGINIYLKENYHYSYSFLYDDFKKKIDKKRLVLARIEEQNKKYKR